MSSRIDKKDGIMSYVPEKGQDFFVGHAKFRAAGPATDSEEQGLQYTIEVYVYNRRKLGTAKSVLSFNEWNITQKPTWPTSD